MRNLVALALLGVAVACSPSFKPASLVDKPRVLGILATPPETSSVGAGVRLQAVLAYPEQVSQLSWTACAMPLGAAAGYACAVPEVPLGGDYQAWFYGDYILQALQAAANPDLFPQFAEFLKMVVGQDDDCLRGMLDTYDACVADHPEDSIQCAQDGFALAETCLRSGGIEVSFHLTVTWKDGSTAEAYKSVLLRDAPQGHVPNHNPGFYLRVVLTDQVTGDRHEVPLPADGVLTLSPGEEVELTAHPFPGSVESYTAQDGSTKDEIVYFSWYATGGSFSEARTRWEWPESRFTAPEAGEWPLGPATEAGGPEERIPILAWVFCRDDRLGTDFLTFSVKPAAPAPDDDALDEADAAGDAEVVDDAAGEAAE
jgi:hypothetical protein